MRLAVTPPLTMVGGAVWVSCYVPRDHPARRIRYGVDGIRASEGPLETIQNRVLVERIPCGRWRAFCQLSTGERHDFTIEVMGCEDSGG